MRDGWLWSAAATLYLAVVWLAVTGMWPLVAGCVLVLVFVLLGIRKET